MTIFLEIVKKFLQTEITSVSETSVEADSGLGNSVVSLFGYGRDSELSKTKRECALTLLIELAKMKDKENDLLSCEQLKWLVGECKRTAKTASDLKNYNEGTFGPAMLAAINLVQNIYEKLAAVNLLDIQHDDDPFNEFRYQMAYYFAQKVSDARNVGIVNTVISNPRLTSTIQIAKEKEALIIHSLSECYKDLQTLDIEHQDYATTRKKRVLEMIKTMREENGAVCKEHSTEIGVPIQLSFFSKVNVNVGTLGPDAGFLEERLKAAVDAIKKDMALESKEMLAL